MFNPAAGMWRRRRQRELAAIVRVLNGSGVNSRILATEGSLEATVRVVRDLAADHDAIIACGGDGTLNEILQGIMAVHPRPALGVVPMGCGNLLAKEVGIAHHPVRAARQLLGAGVTHIPVGVIEAARPDGSRVSRYWTVAAGIGADARVICAIDARMKSRFGIYAYYAESARQLLLTRAEFPLFVVEFADAVRRRRRAELVTQVVAQRVTYFGRCLTALGRGESLGSTELQLVLIKTNRQWAYIHYGVRLMASRVGAGPGSIRDVEFVRAHDVVCRPATLADAAAWRRNGSLQVLAEVDGEFLGGLPLRLAVQADGFDLLLPASTPRRAPR